MGEDYVRPSWRDAAFVTVLAIVLVAGLVHYGLRVSDEPSAGSGALGAPTSSTPSSPTSPATASAPTWAPTPTPSIAAPTDPATPATPADQAEPVSSRGAGTCWDGSATTSLAECSLPTGARGLQWVFPSLSTDRPGCHRARRTTDDYTVVLSYVCFEHALGQAVTVTYDQVADIEQVETWMESVIGEDAVVELPGANGGQCIARDPSGRPVRVSGWYERFPYVVSVYAPTKQAAQTAWKTLVVQRRPLAIRGVKA